ncbi:MAG: formylglycine-generating enzyme family protein [Phycisphaerales bacterium]|nr:formylglycine-generating enzyme family protein [Phycisphaerales bacterium]
MLSTIPMSEQSRTALQWVSLNAARRYCEWLNGRAGDGSPKRHYRLPTEAEWEYACRAGNGGRYCYGNDAAYAAYFANCNGAVRDVQIVATKMPNWFGLFDMHGGLWEWCDSRYEPEYIDDADAGDKEWFVFKGGGYYNPAVRCRATQRNYGQAHYVSYYQGFRVVMEMDGS